MQTGIKRHIQPREGTAHQRILAELRLQGWSLVDGFLPAALVDQLAYEVVDLWQDGSFRPAGVGHGRTRRIKAEVRTDQVQWIDPARCTGSQQLYLNALEELRQALNRSLYLGLLEFEGHLTLYPPGSFYRKHLDQFIGVRQRVLTAILYLNKTWNARDGGQLRLYTDTSDESQYTDILPLGGRLVVFLSARFFHEVLPARRNRLSITGWFRTR